MSNLEIKQTEQLPALSRWETLKLFRGAISPDYFKNHVRPMFYEKCGNDAEKVHELGLTQMHKHGKAFKKIAPFFFEKPRELRIKVKGLEFVPFGTAAGMDKNGEAFDAFENVFGFQEPGTVIVNKRDGNKPIRVAALESELDLFNAQGFPSKGLDYFNNNLTKYRDEGGKAIIYVSICGLPLSETNALELALSEMDTLMSTLNPRVQGFVWNPASPNTAALKVLRVPDIFKQTAELMKSHAPEKLLLVKLGTYEPEEKAESLKLVKAFIDGGGDGVVTTNTKPFQKDQLPSGIRETWGYGSAGRSGKFLIPYMLRSIEDIRIAEPNAIIVGTGGAMYQQDTALEAFESGATMLEGLTPYTYYGPGLASKIMGDLAWKFSNAAEGEPRSLKELQRTAQLRLRKQ